MSLYELCGYASSKKPSTPSTSCSSTPNDLQFSAFLDYAIPNISGALFVGICSRGNLTGQIHP